MTRAFHILRRWLPLAVVTTALCALVYGTVQQSVRQGANDPQIQMAEDAAAALDRGVDPATVVAGPQVDIARSLAPFLLVYDMDGKPSAGSGLLDGRLPDYPIGALQAARSAGANRVTWQPQPAVRIASVAVPYKSGYVVAGRSLREVEKREAQTQTMTLLAWLAALVASFIITALLEYVPIRHGIMVSSLIV
jgi:hypothetical protein